MDYSKVAEKFGITKTTAEEIVKYAMDLIDEEVIENGKCWCGRTHYFKRVDKPERNYRDPRNQEIGKTGPSTFVVYRKRIDAE